jgi:hypothetical protein
LARHVAFCGDTPLALDDSVLVAILGNFLASLVLVTSWGQGWTVLLFEKKQKSMYIRMKRRKSQKLVQEHLLH